MIGCKIGCLCGDINKCLCCIECDNFYQCKEPCLNIRNIDDELDERINNCLNSFFVDDSTD